MPETTIIGNERETVKKVKRSLEGWREIILQLNSVLMWENPWFPAVIAGMSTIVFAVLGMLDPSLLSTLSCIALLASLLDYLVPTLCANLYSPAQWTGPKEKQFDDVCEFIATNYINISQQIVAFKNLKETNPKLYYSVTVVTLVFLAYIGNKINNLLLAYVIATSLLLTPGLVHHGILQKYYQMVLRNVTNLLKNLQGGNKPKTK